MLPAICRGAGQASHIISVHPSLLGTWWDDKWRLVIGISCRKCTEFSPQEMRPYEKEFQYHGCKLWSLLNSRGYQTINTHIYTFTFPMTCDSVLETLHLLCVFPLLPFDHRTDCPCVWMDDLLVVRKIRDFSYHLMSSLKPSDIKQPSTQLSSSGTSMKYACGGTWTFGSSAEILQHKGNMKSPEASHGCRQLNCDH